MIKIDQKGIQLFPYLFKSLKIRNVSIPNRIFFPPWVVNWANKDGSVSDKLYNLYVDLAENGNGIIYTGAAGVSPDSIRFERAMAIYDIKHIESNKKLCKGIEARGAVPAIQLIHYGRQALTTYTGKPILAPSNVPCRVTSLVDPNYKIKEMTIEDIQRVVQDFVKGAVLAVEAGYKIVQVNAAHGYLLCSFLSPHTNRRNDEYGGSTEKRCRIVVEIVEGIRKKLGNDVIIDVRFTVDELIDGGIVPEHFDVITTMVEKAGADMMNASVSNFESALKFFLAKLNPEGRYAYTAETLKKHTSLPVGHAGFIGSLVKGDELIRDQKVDFAGYGRMQIADGEFVRKSVMGGKINKCAWCGKCLGDLFDCELGFSVHCTVNEKYKRPQNAMFNIRRLYREGSFMARKLVKDLTG
ncbi:MAG: hypothetical protein ACM3WV_00510 [Bacillota bacterium]